MNKRWFIGIISVAALITLAVSTVISSMAEDKPPRPMNNAGNKMGPGNPEGGMRQRPMQRERKPVEEPEINREEIYAFLREFDPERLEKLQRLERENPELFMRVLHEASQRLIKLKELKERDPARYQQVINEQTMERSVRELSKKYRESQTPQEKETIKSEMKQALDKIFELKESQRETEIKKLEEEVNKLKEKMKKRKANKDKIIDRRIKIMTGEEEEDDLGW
ncbi:MAG: hypothetical protein WC980_00565 [Candidatus Brocadiia bacterium]